ncbi:glycosyltransferase family 4 protein [Thermodesulfobacteriota bacterium]
MQIANSNNKIGAKILLVSATGGWGGAEQVIYNIGRYLISEGWRVVSACPGDGILAERLDAAGAKVRPYNPVLLNLAHGYRSLPRQLASLRRANREIYRILEAEQVDIIHGNTIQGHWNAFLAARRARLPIVFHAHDILPDSLPHRLWTLCSLYYCNTIIAVSNAVARYLKKCKIPPAKMRVIYPLHDVETLIHSFKGEPEFKAKQDDDRPVVGFIGALIPRKAPRDLILAAKKLISKGFQVLFIFVGDSISADEEYALMTQNLPEKIGIGSYIQFVGFQLDPFSWVKRFDIFVMPSREDPCPLAVFEAMYFRKPVIGTNVGGIPEQISDGETGFIVPKNDPEALAEKLQILIDTPSLRKKMGEAGQRRVTTQFDPKEIFTSILNLYNSLLAND